MSWRKDATDETTQCFYRSRVKYVTVSPSLVKGKYARNVHIGMPYLYVVCRIKMPSTFKLYSVLMNKLIDM